MRTMRDGGKDGGAGEGGEQSKNFDKHWTQTLMNQNFDKNT